MPTKKRWFFFSQYASGRVTKVFFHKVVYIFFSIRTWKNRGLGSCFCLAVGKKNKCKKNIVRCGQKCQSKFGCSVLSIQPSLVFCEMSGLTVSNFFCDEMSEKTDFPNFSS